jgi:hypothetical protein
VQNRTVDEITLGGTHQYVQIRVHGQERPSAVDFDDSQWLIADLQVQVGGMSADVPRVALSIEELRDFATELTDVHRTLTGSAHLESMENWIDVRIEAQANGTLHVEGDVQDQPGTGNALHFTLIDLDQTHLPPLIADLDHALSRYSSISRL